MNSSLRLALLSSALASVAVAATAADLPTRKAAVAPPVLAASMWDGFYVGVQAGYGWTNSNNVVGAANAGASTANFVPLTPAALASASLPLGSASGFSGGAQVGYNKQFGSILLGWESDLFFSGGRGKSAGAITSAIDANPLLAPFSPVTQAMSVSAQTKWLTTTRLRLGFLATPSFLLYGTAGVAAGNVRASTAITQGYATPGFADPGAGFGSYSSSRVGYAIGGGVEWMFAPKWSLRAEYLYYDLGRAIYGVSPVSTGQPNNGGLFALSQVFPSSSVRFNGQLVRLGLNYFWDWRGMLPAPASAATPEFVAWNGFYIGVNAGYSWSGGNGVNVVSTPGSSRLAFAIPSYSAARALTGVLPKASSNGFLGGGQIGTQAQFGSFVTGWETDLQFFGAAAGRASTGAAAFDPFLFAPVFGALSATSKVDWLSTSRARLGYLVTPSVLVYGSGGFAMGGVKSTLNTSLVAPSRPDLSPGYGYGSYSQARVGYSAGAGVEWAVSPNWSVKAEYLYYDLGRATYMASPATSLFTGFIAPGAQAYTSASTRFNGSLVRAGLNYHWNWDQPAVVVAKY